MLTLLSQEEYLEALIESVQEQTKTEEVLCIACNGDAVIEKSDFSCSSGCDASCECISTCWCPFCEEGLLDHQMAMQLSAKALKGFDVVTPRTFKKTVLMDIIRYVQFQGKATKNILETYDQLIGSGAMYSSTSWQRTIHITEYA